MTAPTAPTAPAAPTALRPWILAPPPPKTPARRPGGGPGRAGVDAVLFDRDGTLIEDVPYNADPALVRPRPQARAALDALRARGIPVGVVTNQSGVARGRVPRRAVEAIRERVEELLGELDVWAVCPHAAEHGCPCRKPAPGLIHAACARLGVPPCRAAVIGDIATDLAAARAAGARGVLVPTPATRLEEIYAAEQWSPTPLAAVHTLLSDAAPAAEPAAPRRAGAEPSAGAPGADAASAAARPPTPAHPAPSPYPSPSTPADPPSHSPD
ncbi:HAD-IIIA family hydrolase, partial [Streptomyces sp. 6N223]|uniref:HAD-IIIA family hydrolase n=1 Tax=Streptomyces sp. 6N223 TaxID=3457412 RepID=UPI003FD31FDD